MEIQGNFALPNTQETKPQTEPKGLFDQDTFLKLLVAQLQNPSPFEPPEVDRMMEQAVQFGIIERLVGLEQEMQTMNRSMYMARAAEMIGQTVTVAHEQHLITGAVERVIFNELGADVIINGKPYDINAVLEIMGRGAEAGTQNTEDRIVPGAEPEEQAARVEVTPVESAEDEMI